VIGDGNPKAGSHDVENIVKILDDSAFRVLRCVEEERRRLPVH
jgi:hypothetical protein